MPNALTPDYSIRVVYSKNRLKLQFKQIDEDGKSYWTTAAVVNGRGDFLGWAVEIVGEKNYD